MSKYKAGLEKFIRTEYDSPERKVYKDVMNLLEDLAEAHNRSEDRLGDLIPKVAKLMRKYERSELPVADMLTVMGMKLKDFQKYQESQREDEILDKFVDKVHKAKRQDWFNDFEKKWAGVEEKQKAKGKSPQSKHKSPSVKKAHNTSWGPSQPSSGPVHILQVKRKPKPGQAAGLSARVISREAVPTIEILRALDVSGRSPLKARVLKSRSGRHKSPKSPRKSREAVPAIEILRALDVSGRSPLKARVLKSRSGRHKSPKSPRKSRNPPHKPPQSPRKSQSVSRRRHRVKSDSARRRCNPGSVYHSPSRRCRKEKKMTCKQLRDWYETHHK